MGNHGDKPWRQSSVITFAVQTSGERGRMSEGKLGAPARVQLGSDVMRLAQIRERFNR